MSALINFQWPTAITAIVACLTLIATVYFHYADGRARALEHLLEQRRSALMLALQVIDHVYSNEPLDNGKPFNPHEWDGQLARDADNQMRIYCADPRTRDSFIRAIGLYNPASGKAPGVNLAALDEFRKQIARELGQPEPVSDPNMVWISQLAGARRQPDSGAR